MPRLPRLSENGVSMAYSQDLASASRRHLGAAEQLNDAMARPKRHDVAGYLYGVAGECALKEMMRQSGMRPGEDRRDDPFYAHFPELKTLLRDCLHGRRAGQLRRFAEDDGLMNGWDTTMRYAPAKDIDSRRVDRWRQHAHRLVNAMEET